MDNAARTAVLSLYDAPDPARHGCVIPGYDRDHAARTARIVLRLARELALDPRRHPGLELACLLHDLGRAGMDSHLFGQVFGLAQEAGLPVRLRDLRARYPHVTEAQAPAFFLELVAPLLARHAIPVDDRLRDHIAMRMDFRGRLRRMLAQSAPTLHALGLAVESWMECVMLYYYYPQLMEGQPDDVRLMGMILVACENFEAYNNVRRGRDYYRRTGERLPDVFAALDRFQAQGLIALRVLDALKRLTATGELDAVIKESRDLPADAPLPAGDVAYQQELRASPAP
ncbi:MAG: hypothetical protein EXR49_01925 [Dehalococcoidia bacterium]|nr:hypothetical protein [Dehalococcoidia bacterium]